MNENNSKKGKIAMIVLGSIIAVLIACILTVIIYSSFAGGNTPGGNTGDLSVNEPVETDTPDEEEEESVGNEKIDFTDQETLEKLNKQNLDLSDEETLAIGEGHGAINEEYEKVTKLTGDLTYWYKMQNMMEYGDEANPEYPDAKAELEKCYAMYAEGNYAGIKNEIDEILKTYKITDPDSYELAALYTDACKNIEVKGDSRAAQIAAYDSRYNILAPLYDLTLLDPAVLADYVPNKDTQIPAPGVFKNIEIVNTNGEYYDQIPMEYPRNYLTRVIFTDTNENTFCAYITSYGTERKLIWCFYTGAYVDSVHSLSEYAYTGV